MSDHTKAFWLGFLCVLGFVFVLIGLIYVVPGLLPASWAIPDPVYDTHWTIGLPGQIN